LKENEEVLLAPPAGFTPQGAQNPNADQQPGTVPDVAMPPGGTPPGGMRGGANGLDGAARTEATPGINGGMNGGANGGDRKGGKGPRRGGRDAAGANTPSGDGAARAGTGHDGAAHDGAPAKGDGATHEQSGGGEPVKPAESVPAAGKPDGTRG
jgi:hypothetical protein